MNLRRGQSFALILVAGVAVAGCQSLRSRKPPVAAPTVAVPAPAPVPAPPRVVRVPAKPQPPRACVPKSLPGPPGYPDTDAALRAAAGAADRYQLLAAGRILRKDRLEDLERAVAGCR